MATRTMVSSRGIRRRAAMMSSWNRPRSATALSAGVTFISQASRTSERSRGSSPESESESKFLSQTSDPESTERGCLATRDAMRTAVLSVASVTDRRYPAPISLEEAGTTEKRRWVGFPCSLAFNADLYWNDVGVGRSVNSWRAKG